MIAALYVETGGCYFGLPGVDPWDVTRDARRYEGPYPVVAHPPCQRWGDMWMGSPLVIARTGERKKLGDDDGCFAAALDAVRTWGGVLEHPEGSRAWEVFGLAKPPRGGGWVDAGDGGWTCRVEQFAYGHTARKATWLYAFGCDLPELRWGVDPRKLPSMVQPSKARREAGGRTPSVNAHGIPDKLRNATPPEFRDVLLAIARSRQSANSAIDACNRVPHNTLLQPQPKRRTTVLKYQLMISSDSPHELADLLLTLPDDTGDNLSVSATNNLASAAADNGYTAEAGETETAPKRRGRKPKETTGAVAPPPADVPTPPFDTDVSDLNPGVQHLAGVVAPPPAAPAPPPVTAVPTTPAAPPAPAAPPSAPIPAAPVAPPPVVSAPQPIATPEAPTLEQLKDAMTILMSKVSVQEAQAILKKYTGFGGLIDLLKDGPAWAPIAHYVLSNYPNIPDSVQPRA